MDKKYQVFISSTYEDLKSERAAVAQVLLKMGFIPVGMEQFPASNMAQMEYIKMMMDDCDYYLLILAGKYGSTDADGVGFTEKEYDYAVENGIPIMSILVDDIAILKKEQIEESEEKRILLNDFREKVSAGKMVDFYTDIGSLTTVVATAVHTCVKLFPAKGWIRGNSVEGAEKVEEKIEKYMLEHSITSEDIEALFENNTLVLDGGNAAGTLKAKDTQVKWETIAVTETTKVYASEGFYGEFTFDYSNNNGEFSIGKDEYLFKTKWSRASESSIHAYNNCAEIDAIARIKGPCDLPKSLNGEYDFSSRARTANIGDLIVWRNKHGKYAVTKIVKVDYEGRNADNDLLTCEFVIYE